MVRGVKPKPTGLKLVDGTFRARDRARADAEPLADGALAKPKHLKARASKIWDEVAPLLPWLATADSATLALWCELEVEVRRSVADMTASRISQWRALASELGMTPSGRARIGSQRAHGKAEDPTKKYF